jgi:hypothetical protein
VNLFGRILIALLFSIAAFFVVLFVSSGLIMMLNLNYHDGLTVGGAFFIALAVSISIFVFSMKKTRKEKNLRA